MTYLTKAPPNEISRLEYQLRSRLETSLKADQSHLHWSVIAKDFPTFTGIIKTLTDSSLVFSEENSGIPTKIVTEKNEEGKGAIKYSLHYV